MRRTIITGILAATFLLVSACSSHRYTVVEPRKKELTDYPILEIRDFKSNLGDSESKELAAGFADRLHQKIMQDRQDHPDEVIFDDVVRGINKTEGVLLLDGTIISFEKGSRAKRYFIGFGSGKAYCTIQSIFTDKTTNEQILKLNFDGELSMGLFGGSVDEAVQGVVDAYLDYFSDYFENQGVQVQQAAKEADESEQGSKVAAVPQQTPITRVGLRREPAEVLNRSDITAMLVEYNFFELSRNTQGSFTNDFIDNNDGTVTDRATGLMWQKSGSLGRLDDRSAKKYVNQINRKRYGGHSDWRMPTIEELASLLSRSSNNGVHLAPEFGTHQISCWSADKCDVQFEQLYYGYWIVNFKQGQILETVIAKPSHANSPTAKAKNETNYVKAVRSVR